MDREALILTPRDRERLRGVHPFLIQQLDAVFFKMFLKGWPMFVVQGVRTADQQHQLWLQGRDPAHPGKIITNKDGLNNPSDHQPWSDGFGHAADSAFAKVADPFAPFEGPAGQMFGVLVESHGLVWGGRWTHPHDAPHAQLGKILA